MLESDDKIWRISYEPDSAATPDPLQEAAVLRPARPPSAPAASPVSELDNARSSAARVTAEVRSQDGNAAAPPKIEPDPPQRRRWLRPTLFAGLPVVLIVGGYFYLTGGSTMSTDDAYVNARQVGISTDVAGIVLEVEVQNNQHVARGQVLYRLDPRPFQIALDNAKSNLAQTRLSLESMKQDYQQMLSEAASEHAQVSLDEITFRRNASLLAAQAIAKAMYDSAQFTLETDTHKLQSLQEQAASELVKLDGHADTPVEALPQYQQAMATLHEAQRQLDHTVVRAPFSGTATDVPSIAPGKYLAASTTAFFLVDTDHVWIDATPKETELTYVRAGQPAQISVDAYPGLVWQGTVQSISPAAAQQFSLLPAQNTSGNWVKVVQRVPLRVRVDTSDKQMPVLRAGMSVVVGIKTGHTHAMSLL